MYIQSVRDVHAFVPGISELVVLGGDQGHCCHQMGCIPSREEKAPQHEEDFKHAEEIAAFIADTLDADNVVSKYAIPFDDLEVDRTIRVGIVGDVIQATYLSIPVLVKRMPQRLGASFASFGKKLSS
ncbi:hypothetical protein AC1031_009433 [Aphanomyces cochlioides]|nr:hypothetical protein AC1031_009433 [Aphanomyces cochlioides]